MTFVGRPFVYLLCATFALWWLVRRDHRLSLCALLAASLVFYGYNRWWLIGLILAYCIVDWMVAVHVEKTPHARWVLALGVTFNVLVLCFWKYTPWLLSVAVQAVGWIGLPASMAPPTEWHVPFGLSFYAFTGIAYMVDVYRAQVPAERNLLRFCVFLTFFPQLVAGPILRAVDFLPQLRSRAAPQRAPATLEAAMLVGRGYFKKTVLADRIGAAIDPFFLHVGSASTEGVWSLPFVYLYALQIYLDFSACTDIARGLALWFGFRWPENFDLPYLATSIQEFWRRWHMTLSAFLRDYVFFPLAGVRSGRGRRYGALFGTMLVCGLWHGASWTFVLWGGMHGAMLVAHRMWYELPWRQRWRHAEGPLASAGRVVSVLLTFHCVALTWCFFRLTNLDQSLACVRQWFSFSRDRVWAGGVADASLWSLLGIYALTWLLAATVNRWRPLQGTCEAVWSWPSYHGAAWGVAAGLLLLAFILSPGVEAPPFIYFQF